MATTAVPAAPVAAQTDDDTARERSPAIPKPQPFKLEAGSIYPKTPYGNTIQIAVFGVTGEWKAGKSILGLSIAPGVHPSAHPFAGKPRTLYFDFEKSGTTYWQGAGCEYVDVHAKMTELYGNKGGGVDAYTPLDIFTWWLKALQSIKPGQYDVIMADPITDIEDGATQYVRQNSEKFNLSSKQVQKGGGLLWGALKAFYKATLLSCLASRCQTFFFTAHLRDEWSGESPTGRREPKGKDTLMELASLYLWLKRDVVKEGPLKGSVLDIPEADVIKQRIADTRIDPETGELQIKQLLPPHLPAATIGHIRGYIANGYGKKPSKIERVVKEEPTEQELLHLRQTTAQAESDAAVSKLSLLERQAQLRAMANAATAAAPQAPDMASGIAQQKAEGKVQAAAVATEKASVEKEAEKVETAAATVATTAPAKAADRTPTAQEVSDAAAKAKAAVEKNEARGAALMQDNDAVLSPGANATLDQLRGLKANMEKLSLDMKWLAGILKRINKSKPGDMTYDEAAALLLRLDVEVAKRGLMDAGTGGTNTSEGNAGN